MRLKVLVFPLQWLLWFAGSVIVAGGLLALGRKPGRRSSASKRGDRIEHADA